MQFLTMARRSHTRQKSDDSKLAFELGEVNASLISDETAFRGRKTKISCCVRFARIVRAQLRKVIRRIPVNWTILSIALLSLSLLIPIVLALVTYFLYPTVVDMSLQSFQIPSQVASLNQDAFTVAKKESHRYPGRIRRSADPVPDPWPLPPSAAPNMDYRWYTQSKSKWTIDLIYLAQGQDTNMFTVDRLQAAHHVEQQIMKFAGFLDFCWKSKIIQLDPILSDRYNACTPPISLLDFFFPSPSPALGITFYDGQGVNLTHDSMNKIITFLLSKPLTYWFVDGNFSATNRRSSFLRAQIKFGFPLKGYSMHDYKGPKMDEQRHKFKVFMVKLISFLKTLSNDKIKVLYGGPEVFDYLVNKTMWDDVKLAKYTLIVIIIFVFLLTHFSLFLTLFGMLSILASLPCAYFVFRVIFGVPNVTILSGTSLFIIIGIGVDDVFVFINTFIHAKYAKDIQSRLKHTVTTAGGATFFTSFTTAAAFGANCLSKLPAIHDFGLFMMLIVISCWITVLLMIPPTLFLWHQYVHKLERRLSNLICRCIPLCGCCVMNAGLPGDIEHFLAGNSEAELLSENEEIPSNQTLDAVTGNPLPSDDSNTNISDTSDLLWLSDDGAEPDCVPLLSTGNETQANITERRTNHSLMCGSSLQLCLFYYSKPVTICRYGFLLLYLAFLGGSLYLDTKITPSERPPAFFKEGSNLQQLLDVKYNMSKDNYDCKICDDIVEISSNFIGGLPTIHSTKLPTTASSGTSVTSTRKNPATTMAYVLGTKQQTTIHSTTRPSIRTKSTSSATQGVSSKSQSAKPPLRRSSKPSLPMTARRTKKPTTAGNGIPQRTLSNNNDGNNISDEPTAPAGELPDPCSHGHSNCTPVEKPRLGKHVTVKVVFGIKGIDRSQIVRQHVIQSKGRIIMDPKFTALYRDHHSVFIKYMCRLCNAFANNKELVRKAGAECFPVWLLYQIHTKYQSVPECNDIKSYTDSNGKTDAKMYYKRTSHAVYHNSTKALWLVMSFESTIPKTMASREMLKWYNKWDTFLNSQVDDIAELQSAFHTSDSWVHMFMEIIAVNGAIYGIGFSLFLCMVAVIIFTGHIMLSIIVILTILGVLCFVVGIFYLVGWHLGAVEAISLSILVGTSVDYCVHLVDGYIIAGRYLPNSILNNKDVRGWRTAAAVSHIGSSILSSAITTIAASIPLCLTTIQLFAKFGQILAINTAVSIVYTLTFCLAFLTIMAPPRFCRTLKSRLKALIGVLIFAGMASLCLYIVSLKGIPIPGPDGNPLFKI